MSNQVIFNIHVRKEGSKQVDLPKQKLWRTSDYFAIVDLLDPEEINIIFTL